jgi:hypothetical protein
LIIFVPKSPKDGDVIASDRGLIGILTPMIGSLWATIVAVELLDVTFSIDNIFAAVALTDKLWLIMVGVGIGILAMRFVAQSFVGLLKKYPRLESAAFLVIGLLGIKLLVTTGCGFMENNLCTTLESETVDIIFSVLSVALFALPILEQWVMEKKEKILTRPTLPQKHYLYHKVPPHMHGKVLFPLNDLRAIDEDLYLLQEKKYEGRKNIMKREIPPLDCLWNDVLHFSPIHPALLKKELESRGLAIKEFQYFQIDPEMLDPERTIVYLCQREVLDNSINPKDFVAYNPSLVGEYSQVPDRLKKYYQDKIDQGETPLLYAGAPHILYRGTLDISQVPIVKI